MAPPAQSSRPEPDPQAAIGALVREHGDRIYRLARRLCPTREDAEDAVQDTFLNAYRGWGSFDGRSKASTWLYSIAVRTCRRRMRKRAGEPKRVPALSQLAPFRETGVPELSSVLRAGGAPGDGGDPGNSAVRREAVERVDRAIGELPDAFRLAVVLKEIVGLSVEETAGVLAISVSAVKSRLHRGRLMLREALLRPVGFVPADDPAYSRRICFDLLKAKLDSMDRGVAFDGDSVVCERCRSVFRTLDLTGQVCRALREGDMPDQLRARLDGVLAGG